MNSQTWGQDTLPSQHPRPVWCLSRHHPFALSATIFPPASVWFILEGCPSTYFPVPPPPWVPPPHHSQGHFLEQKQLMMLFSVRISELDPVYFSVPWPRPATSHIVLLCSCPFHDLDSFRNVLSLQDNLSHPLEGSPSTPFHFAYSL